MKRQGPAQEGESQAGRERIGQGGNMRGGPKREELVFVEGSLDALLL